LLQYDLLRRPELPDAEKSVSISRYGNECYVHKKDGEKQLLAEKIFSKVYLGCVGNYELSKGAIPLMPIGSFQVDFLHGQAKIMCLEREPLWDSQAQSEAYNLEYDKS